MARPVTIMLDHDLGKDGARARVDEGFEQLSSSLGGGMMFKFQREWAGDTLKFKAKGMGQNIFGDIDIFDKHVRIVVTLPGVLANLAEMISGKVEKQGQILLEKK